MPARVPPFVHLRDALGPGDLEFLRRACREYVPREGIPCYVLIDRLYSPTYLRIKRSLEGLLGESIYYLNDFYIYTDDSFTTNWHIDTELFSFDRAINAWILLSPEIVEDPVGFIDQINNSHCEFHGVRVDGDRCVFGNYCTGARAVRSLSAVEAEKIHTPRIRVGDILLLNPKRFHRTNVYTPKHALVLKFVMQGETGFLSREQVDSQFWPEVEVFNCLVKKAHVWEDVIDGIRQTLMSRKGRKVLSEGFLPEHFELFSRMATAL